MEDDYITTKEAKEISKVTVKTLRLWDKEGKICTIRTSSNIRRYNIKDIQNIIGNSNPVETKEKICYCRVSSRKQMDNLIFVFLLIHLPESTFPAMATLISIYFLSFFSLTNNLYTLFLLSSIFLEIIVTV
jgi:hypothetical protein